MSKAGSAKETFDYAQRRHKQFSLSGAPSLHRLLLRCFCVNVACPSPRIGRISARSDFSGATSYDEMKRATCSGFLVHTPVRACHDYKDVSEYPRCEGGCSGDVLLVYRSALVARPSSPCAVRHPSYVTVNPRIRCCATFGDVRASQ